MSIQRHFNKIFWPCLCELARSGGRVRWILRMGSGVFPEDLVKHASPTHSRRDARDSCAELLQRRQARTNHQALIRISILQNIFYSRTWHPVLLQDEVQHQKQHKALRLGKSFCTRAWNRRDMRWAVYHRWWPMSCEPRAQAGGYGDEMLELLSTEPLRLLRVVASAIAEQQ
jgi:hypothetical protein